MSRDSAGTTPTLLQEACLLGVDHPGRILLLVADAVSIFQVHRPLLQFVSGSGQSCLPIWPSCIVLDLSTICCYCLTWTCAYCPPHHAAPCSHMCIGISSQHGATTLDASLCIGIVICTHLLVHIGIKQLLNGPYLTPCTELIYGWMSCCWPAYCSWAVFRLPPRLSTLTSDPLFQTLAWHPVITSAYWLCTVFSHVTNLSSSLDRISVCCSATFLAASFQLWFISWLCICLLVPGHLYPLNGCIPSCGLISRKISRPAISNHLQLPALKPHHFPCEARCFFHCWPLS